MFAFSSYIFWQTIQRGREEKKLQGKSGNIRQRSSVIYPFPFPFYYCHLLEWNGLEIYIRPWIVYIEMQVIWLHNCCRVFSLGSFWNSLCQSLLGEEYGAHKIRLRRKFHSLKLWCSNKVAQLDSRGTRPRLVWLRLGFHNVCCYRSVTSRFTLSIIFLSHMFLLHFIR